MKAIIPSKSIVMAGAAIGALAVGIWLAPVTTEASGTVAAADDTHNTGSTYSSDCSDAVWPNIPAECLKDVKDDRGNASRVVTIATRKG